MIRINLLPVKAMRRREAAKRQIFLGLAVFAWMIALIVVFHGISNAEVSGLQSTNQGLEKAIAQLKAEVGDYDVIKAQREELLRQRTAIERLERDRSGPVFVLRELSDILTPGRGPTYDRARYEEALRRDPNAGIDMSWEPKRAWIISYAENERAVTIHMGGKSDDDVAEFTKRLKLSAFFSDVYWKQTQPQVDLKSSQSYVTFDVTCRVNY